MAYFKNNQTSFAQLEEYRARARNRHVLTQLALLVLALIVAVAMAALIYTAVWLLDAAAEAVTLEMHAWGDSRAEAAE